MPAHFQTGGVLDDENRTQNRTQNRTENRRKPGQDRGFAHPSPFRPVSSEVLGSKRVRAIQFQPPVQRRGMSVPGVRRYRVIPRRNECLDWPFHQSCRPRGNRWHGGCCLSRLELNRPRGSASEAPLAKVIFTTFLYVSPVQMIPACDQTGTPAGFDGFLHFTSSTTSGSASWMSFRTRASVSPRQSFRSSILASIS